MLLKLFKNVDGCVSDPLKVSSFLKYPTQTQTTFLKNPSNVESISTSTIQTSATKNKHTQ